MEDRIVTGLIKKSGASYTIITDDGKEYYLSAILPWEAVSADYGVQEFESNVGKYVTVKGLTDGHTIYRATLRECDLK